MQKPPGGPKVPRERREFRALLATNPNFFGTLEGAELSPVLEKAADTTYEELVCVGYHPGRAELEATLAQKRGSGYRGGPCSSGSREYVRFFVDEGSGWRDVGLAGVRVTDLDVGRDCEGESTHPLHHTLTASYDPEREPCTEPRLVRVRAILSWDTPPPADQPDRTPVWGNVLECAVQVAPDPAPSLDDLVALDDLLQVLDLPEPLLPALNQPLDLPEPGPEPLPALAERGLEHGVEPHRFAFGEALALTGGPDLTADALNAAIGDFGQHDLDLPGILEAIEETDGDTSYEELVCVGLDDNRERLVATFRVKRPFGYSGTLCGKGSTEHVAFWADWDDSCEWTHLGTAEVDVHDLEELPDGGLCYSAVLPRSLDELRPECEHPRVARIRAVLSWSTPPSPSDPDRIPVWGNRLDVHVRVSPGPSGDPEEPGSWITLIGGVNVGGISASTGRTTSSAVFGFHGTLAGADRPFGGRIVVHGPLFPGRDYRLLKRPVGTSTWTPMTDGFRPVREDGTAGPPVTPASDGTVTYLDDNQNFTRILGRFTPGGDGHWEIRLELIGEGHSPVHRIQVDNTAPEIDLAITSGAGECGRFPVGATIGGEFAVGGPRLAGWKLWVPDPDPEDGNVPNDVDTGALASPDAVPSGSPWSLETDAPAAMRPCGYNIVLRARDNTIRNSSPGLGNRARTREGFCIEES